MKSPHARSLTLLAVLAAVLTVGFPSLSTAAFTSSSRSNAVVRAAADWTPPTVAVLSPGAAVKEVVTVAIQAGDADSGIASVTLEQLAPGASAWAAVCTDTTAPYTCAWDTRALADGQHSLRARATDRAGYSATSDVVRTTVANKVLVVLADPGDAVRGTVALTASVYNAGSLSHSVRFEYAVAGSGTWKSICTGVSGPYTCQWATTTMPSGDYDLRAVLVSGSTSTASAPVEGVSVDNVSPAVSLSDPGSPLSGLRTFAATATDAHSGVDRVGVQYAATGTSVWRDLCTLSEEPWSCRVDTTALADGSYGFRAVAVDAAGNSTTSPVVANRVVDNTVASVSVEATAVLTGRAAIGAAASSTAGVASIRIQAAPAGSGAWFDLCTDTTAPFSCAWDTTTVADGRYDLRAVLLDGLGRTTHSPVSEGHLVDNSPLRGLDVQTANGGANPGKAENGDSLTFTYSSEVDPRTILAGWDGTARAVTVRMRDGDLLGLGSRGDTLDVLASGGAVNLGTVNLKQDYVRSMRTVQLGATMVLGSAAGPQGVLGSTVTIHFGQTASSGPSSPKTVRNSSTMVWTPSGSVLDMLGRACSVAPVSETGAPDREF